jgi:hypothetical protein
MRGHLHVVSAALAWRYKYLTAFSRGSQIRRGGRSWPTEEAPQVSNNLLPGEKVADGGGRMRGHSSVSRREPPRNWKRNSLKRCAPVRS